MTITALEAAITAAYADRSRLDTQARDAVAEVIARLDPAIFQENIPVQQTRRTSHGKSHYSDSDWLSTLFFIG